MNGISVGCWSSLLLAFLHAGLGSAHPVTWSPSGQELQSLQDLLERLKEKFEQGERETLDLEVPDYRAEDAADVSPFDLADSASHLNSPSPLQQTEVINQWRKFLASPKRRRHFSGCFGARLERIGTQTGLGCNIYKSRSRRKSRS
ncbi:natriuretic peptides B-like [Hemicordylus capensis]|uniref:natriuretic peptides B-like n=1 Tax=Hemicordylus capensis TaxID=884348 RepID=UPI002303CFB6|nr:natriuretic peptides B-like [Hemicordylus capensis]